MPTDAKVSIGVEGGEEVARAADRALRPWTTAAETAKGAVQGMGAAVTSAFNSVVNDVARGVTAFAAFDLSSRIPAAIAYREEVARIAVVAGESSDHLRQRFAQQEAATLSARSENEKFAASFGRLTYNYKDATEAAAALGTEALATNRSLSEMAGVGKVIYEATGSIKNAPEILARVHAQAEKLGTLGGPDALRDQLEGLGGVINRLASQSPAQLADFSATLGAIGKGLRPDQAKEAQRAIVGAITGDTMKTERFLRSAGELKRGESILDEHGQIKNLPDAIDRYQRAWRKEAGSETEARRLARLHFGDVPGAAFLNADLGEAAALAGLGPSGDAQAKANALLSSDEGRRKAAELKARGAQQDIAAGALPAVDAVLGFAAEHPLIAGAGALLAPGLVAKGSSALLGAGLKLLTGAGSTGAAGAAGAGGLATGGAGAAGASSLELAAEGGWLSANATGITGGLATGVGAAGAMVLGSAAANAKVLSEIGEDRGTMGRKYRATHGGVETLEAYSKAQRAAAGEFPEDAPLVAYRAARGAGASAADAEEIAKRIQVNVTISNNSHVPSEQLAVQSATGASGQQ